MLLSELYIDEQTSIVFKDHEHEIKNRCSFVQIFSVVPLFERILPRHKVFVRLVVRNSVWPFQVVVLQRTAKKCLNLRYQYVLYRI